MPNLSRIEAALRDARARIGLLVDTLARRAHAERRAMHQRDRRSLGQRVRYTRVHIERARACVNPAVFRYRQELSARRRFLRGSQWSPPQLCALQKRTAPRLNLNIIP